VAVIQQGHRVLYRETHTLVDELADAQLAGTRKATLAHLTPIPLLILDDLDMRKLPPTAAEDLLEIVMRRYERALSESSHLAPQVCEPLSRSATIP